MHQTGITKKRSNYFKILILFSILFFLISTAYITVSCKKNTAVPETATVKRTDIIQSIDISGNVDASQSKNLSLPSSGKVLKSVEKGDFLKKGDVLIEIDNRKTKLLVSQAQENIKIAESSLALAKINYKNALDANHIAIQVAQENNNLARQSAENAFKTLENTNGLGSTSIESAQTALTNAQNSYNASINQAKTALDQANYQLSVAKNNNVTGVTLSQYEAAAANAQASYNTAVNNATSSINSAAEAVASSEAQAKLNSESAEGAYKQALINQSVTYWNTLSSLEQAQKQISATLESINSAQEQVNLAKINLDIASIELENSVILMPFDGYVQTVNFKEGEYLSPGLTAVSVISNDFLIKADVEETDIGKIKTGQDVDISLDAFPDEKIKGTVEKISPVSKNTAGVISFQITIKPLDAKPGILMFGLSANATIYTSKVENVLIIPSLAVFEENNKNYVWMLNDKKEAVKVEVETGLSDLENTEIKSGLKEGDIILLSKPEVTKNSISLFNK
jgi:RND family efflux transporter MFP subunit